MTAGRFLRWVAVEEPPPTEGYPFNLPAVQALRRSRLSLAPGVTFLIGDNGTGKSTLVEAIAVACGFNAEGGSRSFNFATQHSESDLGSHLRVGRAPGRERTSYFLRAESFYNVATEIDRLDSEPAGGAKLIDAYGGRSLHQRSHGESFLDLLLHRFRPRGLYLLDEPEAALSPRGLLAALARIHDLVAAGSQFVIATHSPILLALPGARIVQLEGDGTMQTVDYDEAEPVALTRAFLEKPERILRELLD